MNQHSERFLNGESTLRIDPKHERVYKAVARMLEDAAATQATGEGYIRITFNQGGVRGVKRSLEQPD